ncbi:MAG TPA: peptidylprolyl isomerase [Spirochaetales bacterium]|nr:peptidylprolyl isomerase [Spirochaetales bacterium]HRY54570.1 peptidylprolyl isomerase [Spirochaetia bacterium]HRZ64579.1 peptidylprolyl isomerase [Spirochaetia bacterium]
MPASRVRLETSLGDLLVELFDEDCPVTVKNFLGYVRSGHYDGTIFHRVIPGFVVQGGGMLPGMVEKETGEPIANEAAKAPRNLRGTLAMARTMDPDSATCQFYINLSDNRSLDYAGGGPRGAGYCAFGKVVEGMEAVDAMAAAPTGRRPPHADVPKTDIVLKKASLA